MSVEQLPVEQLTGEAALSISVSSATIKFESPLTSKAIVFRNEESETTRELAAQLAKQLAMSIVTARILVGRGLSTAEAINSFLTPTLREHLPDPKNIKNMVAAAEMLLKAVESKKVITIYSDFDVDGLSSGAQLYLFLKAIGGVVNHYAPDRFTEGYGLVKEAVERLGKSGTEVLVTVDCGISSVEEIALAKRLGMATIILDHHQPHVIPGADVVVDPAQDGCPFKEHQLAAAGLIWMLLILLKSMLRDSWAERLGIAPEKLPDPKDFLDLAALGTICDMVPLRGLNRLIASRGLEAMKVTKRPGLIALKEVAGLPANRMTCGHVSFGLGPRINATGRLSSAREMFDLLTTGNTINAQKIAESADRLNAKRKSIEDEVKRLCFQQLQQQPQLQTRSAYALYGETFHLGVIGIVASRMVEQFGKPAAIMGPAEVTLRGKIQKVAKGSVRSIKGFHVAQVLDKLSEYLISHGGHAEAGGFSVSFDRLEEFQQAFVMAAEELLSPHDLKSSLFADIEVRLGEIDFALINELLKIAPFGVGNPTPTLVSRAVYVEAVSSISGKHLRLRFSDGKNNMVNAVAWNLRSHPLLTKGEQVNIAYQPEINTYHGVSSVQLNLKQVWRED